MDLLRAPDLAVHILLLLPVEGQELRGLGVELVFCLRVEQFVLILNIFEFLFQFRRLCPRALDFLVFLLANLLKLDFQARLLRVELRSELPLLLLDALAQLLELVVHEDLALAVLVGEGFFTFFE